MFSYMTFLILTVLLTELAGCETFKIKSNASTILGKRMFTIFENNPYVAFWKIPYAEPPTNDLRFKVPKSRLYFRKGLNNFTLQFKDSCTTFQTEDCLYLSIYVPIGTVSQKLAVIVWLHEESFSHGPDFFIDQELVVVTVSYRTGVFGFLNTEDEYAQGNMGAKDVLNALEFVRDNIALFNGDPNRVTVAGSSTASTLTASLPLSNLAHGLFSRVIVHSGSALSPADYNVLNFEITTKLYKRLNGYFEKFDRKKLYSMLSTISIQNLTRISSNLFDSTEVRDRQRLINSFSPSIEVTKRAFMNKNSVEVYNRKLTNNAVEVMMGYTSFESLYKLSGLADNRKLLPYLNYNFQYLIPFEGTIEEYDSKRYKEIRNRIMEFYFLNGTIGERSFRRYAKYVADRVIYPLLRQARLHSLASCRNVYVYRFPFKGLLNVSWRNLIPNLSYPGATTEDEICYLFRCKSFDNIYSSLEAQAEWNLIRKMTRLWANFVKFGDPTPNSTDAAIDNIKWTAFKQEHFKVLNFARTITMRTATEMKRAEFWDQLKEEYYGEN